MNPAHEDSVPGAPKDQKPILDQGADHLRLHSESIHSSESPLKKPEVGEQVVCMEPVQFHGRVLNHHEASLLTSDGSLGAFKISHITQKTSPISLGMEIEESLVRSDLRPAVNSAKPLISRMENDLGICRMHHPQNASMTNIQRGIECRVGGEWMSWQVEHKTPFTEKVGGCELFNLELKIRSEREALRRYAESYGLQLLSTGILPTIMPQHMVTEAIFPHYRYHDLGAAVEDFFIHRQGSYSKRIDAREGPVQIEYRRSSSDASQREAFIRFPHGSLLLRNVSPLLEGSMTSLQFHFTPPALDQYVGYHRLSDWIGPVLVGISAGTPLLFGKQTGFKESRIGFIWDIAMHRDRCGYIGFDGGRLSKDGVQTRSGREERVDGWLDHEYQQFMMAQLYPLLEPARAGKRANEIETNSDKLERLRTIIAIENSKTMWPYTRTTLGLNENFSEGSLRFENRVMSNPTTIIEKMAYSVFGVGLLVGLHEDCLAGGIKIGGTPSELNRRMSYHHMVRNMELACVDGLQAKIKWFDGEEFILSELIRDELIGFADRGLTLLGVHRDDIERYLTVIRRHVNFDMGKLDHSFDGLIGITPADIMLYIDTDLRNRAAHLSEEERCAKLVELLIDASRTDTAHPGVSPRDTWDIVRWFAEKYLQDDLDTFLVHPH